MSDDSPHDTPNPTGMPEMFSAAREVATKSVMTPLQWILAIVGATSVMLATLSPDWWVRSTGVLVFLATVVFALWKYHFFSKTEPELLQSESYRHAQSRLKQEGKLLIDERNRNNPKVLEGRPVVNSHLAESARPHFSTAGTDVIQEDKSR